MLDRLPRRESSTVEGDLEKEKADLSFPSARGEGGGGGVTTDCATVGDRVLSLPRESLAFERVSSVSSRS